MTAFDEESFWKKVHSLCDEHLLYSSRIHCLNSFSTQQSPVYIKREDESSFGISGYKKRKFASLLPYILSETYEKVSLIGGAHSNHIVGAIQLLKEVGLPYRLFLKKPHTQKTRGNMFLLALLAESEEIEWIEAKDWPEVEKIARRNTEDSREFLVPEGGFCPAAIPGLCTLWQDILRNQRQAKIGFQHIVMDAGTGFSAAVLQALLGAFSAPTTLHVVLMADSTGEYLQKYQQIHQEFEEIFDISFSPIEVKLYKPPTAQAFGSVNSQVKKFCQKLAREEGVLSDPIYSAKMFMQAKNLIKKREITGPTLLIHSGGGTGLLGFSEKWNLPFT